ncbi:MAG: hypothetical protein IKJ23_02645 [Bacteroidaceae bacterium]|nr:hypothetical protein [Bacteroidaceae bacterium]
MIVVIAYIINLFAPIVNTFGTIGLCGCIVYDDFHILYIAAVMAILGLVFGIIAYRNDIPPRWFWSKSKNRIFSFSVSAVLGYSWSFAAWVFTIYLITVIAEKV